MAPGARFDHERWSRERSYWLREALANDPGEPCPPLSGHVEADVLIVGGGYTGMWTAHFLKDREPAAEDVRAICRSPTFRAGILLELSATVQPARLARGLRRVILEQGVRVFEGSPVRRFRAGSAAEAVTPGGTVRAPRAVLGI